MSNRALLSTGLGCVALVGGGAGLALAAQGDTQITVGAITTLNAGDRAPFDAPGVRAIRRGQPIPRGYVLVGRKIDIKRGRNAAGAGLRYRCPGNKRLRTFGETGQAGFRASTSYEGRRSTYVFALGDARQEESSGTLYAVCR